MPLTNGNTAVMTEVVENTDTVTPAQAVHWKEYGNHFVLMNCVLPPEVATSEGYELELKKGQRVILDIDFLAQKYGRDIQSLGFNGDKDGWLDLQANLYELYQEKAKQEVDLQLLETAKHLYKINPSKSVEVYYKELKNIAS